MWKVLLKSAPYLISFLEESNDFYHIGVTDFIQYWTILTTKATFLHELKESNDGLEFDDDNELVQKGLDMIKNPETLKYVRVDQEDKGEMLKINMAKSYEFTMKVELGLLEGSSQSLFDVVIQPLLMTINDLRSSQQEMRELLLKKDKEIAEYKVEGKAPRRLITTVYDDAAHMNKHTGFEQLFNDPAMPEILQCIATRCPPERKLLSTIRRDNLKAYETTPTTSKSSAGESSENISKPLASSSIVPKIEKLSQNTLIDEIVNMEPDQLDIEAREFSVASNVEVKMNGIENSPVAKKRQKRLLNF